MSIFAQIKFNADGLVPAIAQERKSGEVLMMAWMNREAVNQTIATGYAHYYSRSRQSQWKKGERSGHVQKICNIQLDCDGDTLLLTIEQTGAACHTNNRTCFYRHYEDEAWVNNKDAL
ncbi:MAG: phosphoribosyl-AMP cyclohydrolase [Zetaproteobacteria bacterium]|nr:phosphoribosyl-AMP cyclohydrolase [Zetaproteobacteria bacterium]